MRFLVATFGLFAFSISGCSSRDAYREQLREESARSNAAAKEFVERLNAQGAAYLAEAQKRLESYTPALRLYFSCNKQASKIVSTQIGDPAVLAVAARNFCVNAENELRNAINAAYADNPGFGLETMEKSRTKALENNVGSIVAFRMLQAPRSMRNAAPPNTNNEQHI